MSLGERLNRRLDRPATGVDPWFRGKVPGYAQPSEVDSSGYTLRDPFADQGQVAAYDDPTVDVVPGGALGEAGAGWRRADESDLMPAAEYIGPQHAIPSAPTEYGEGVEVGDRTLTGRETGLGRIAAATEYQAREPGRRALSDREVYADLYGNDGADGGGDSEGGRMMAGRRLVDSDSGLS